MACPTPSRRALVVVALVVTTSGSLAASSPSFAKTRTPKCKAGQMLVRIGKKPVCKKTASLFPLPQAGDSRLAFVKYALAPATTKIPGKRGKRVRTFASFKASKKARKQILRLLPKVLKQVDAAQGGQAASATRARPLIGRAAGGCLPPGAESPKYTSKDGNSTMTASMDADGMSIGFDGTTSGGISIHFTYTTDAGCGAMKVPDCPQANGEVKADSTKNDDVLVEVTEGKKVLSFTHVKGTRTTRATGQNAADAKLDWVRIEDTLASAVTVEGKGFPRTTISGTFERTAVWDMRADRWMQDKFQVKVTGNIQIDEPVSAFSNLVREIRSAFRKAEQEGSSSRAGWSKPESKCITVEWSPASDTTKVKKNDTGTAAGKLQASTGGTAADGNTKVGTQSGGTFSPAEVKGATPSLNYTVTASSGALSVTVQATSTAGAGSGEWHQPIENKDSPDRISGPFSGHYLNGQLLAEWSGTATWKRAPNLDEGNTTRRYYLESASYTVQISGDNGICPASGTGSFSFGAQPTQPSFTIYNPASDVVFGSPDKDWVLPFTYAWAIYPPPNEGRTTYTLHDCPAGYEANNGMAYTFFVSDLVTGHLATTSDGLTFAGSTAPEAGRGETWSFTGSG